MKELSVDCRTSRALQHNIDDLLAGKEIKIGKHEYFINGSNLKTKQDKPVYYVMQDNKVYAYLFYIDNSDSEIGMSSGLVIHGSY